MLVYESVSLFPQVAQSFFNDAIIIAAVAREKKRVALPIIGDNNPPLALRRRFNEVSVLQNDSGAHRVFLFITGIRGKNHLLMSHTRKLIRSLGLTFSGKPD